MGRIIRDANLYIQGIFSLELEAKASKQIYKAKCTKPPSC
jgi:hypothetical protein